MANKMLIDATHPEETRVVVLRGSRIEEFDFESSSKRQLRGNIYLAKVIRVEPSLQAAFVDYGGNRHGFLAFSEIHPDYYQIPFSDRQALVAEDEQEEPEEEERRPRRSRRRRDDSNGEAHGDGRPQAAAARHGDQMVSGPADMGAPIGERHSPDAGPGEGAGTPSAALETAPTSPYDDFTAELIERASRDHEGEAQSEGVYPASDRAGRLQAEETHADGEAPAAPDHASDQPAPGSAEPAASAHETAAEGLGAHQAAALNGPAEAPVSEQVHATADDFAVPPASDAAVDTGSTEMPASEATVRETSERLKGRREVRGHEFKNDDHKNDELRDDEHDEEEEQVDQIGGDALEEVPRRVYRSRRQYKIQEVIKRRQVLLVQVVKEERGNKGAALTTYLSLAGRYSVLMPNTARGGGISRKITDAGDRQRLKTIAQDLEVPDGMGVILRTAGAARTKPEVKRDFEYLMRMWETVRETTLASTAPTLVYEEGSLIKRAIRDLYNKDVEEIVVAGEDGYREAKDFMRLLQPSHTRNVLPWRDAAPLFAKNGAEAQLDAMFHNHVTLKSGGTLVINQTEALVAIDVNSGRATREHNIEDTALRTNLEAADEVARQLRLRDLAGLIVVDFIDMEEGRNNRAVERRMKDALKDDRARIQIGRISHFGLLEMSRQRIRTGVLEGSTEACPHCAGAGTVRSTASIALYVLRALEEALLLDRSRDMIVRTRGGVALYILNHKRAHLSDLEARFGIAVIFQGDEALIGTTYCALERGEPASGVPQPLRVPPPEEPEVEAFDAGPEEEAGEDSPSAVDGGDGETRRRRRRRRGRGGSSIADDAPQPSDDALALLGQPEPARAAAEPEEVAEPVASEDGASRRRRSRRGGRRGREGRIGVRAEDEILAADGEESTTMSGEDATGEQEAVPAPGGEPVEAAAAIPPADPAMEVLSRHGSDARVDEMPLHGGTSEHPEDEPVEAMPAGATPVEAVQAKPTHLEPTHPEAVPTEAVDASQADLHPIGAPHVDASAPSPLAAAPEAEPSAAAAIGVVPAAASVNAPLVSSLPEPTAAEAPRSEQVDASGSAPAHEEDADAMAAASRRAAPISSEPDPSRPKRSGWWQKAKATLGG